MLQCRGEDDKKEADGENLVYMLAGAAVSLVNIHTKESAIMVFRPAGIAAPRIWWPNCLSAKLRCDLRWRE